MKKLSLAFFLMSSLIVSANENRPGAPVKQALKCSAIRAPKSLAVKLELIRAAVNPQYNIRGATVTKMKFDPANGNPQAKFVLKEVSQTAYNAVFTSKDIRVEIDKSPLKANVFVGDAEYLCK